MSGKAFEKFGTFYEMILCHYSEVGLKAPRLKTRLENLIIDHTSKICQRESLHLLRHQQIQDRLLFYFPNQELLSALTVFRYVLGIQSISPAFSASKNLEMLKQKLLQFTETYLHSKEKFTVQFKSIKAMKQPFKVIQKEIGMEIVTHLEKFNKRVKYINGKTDKTIFIEVRENESYIYTDKITTIWGGLPLDIEKSAFLPISEMREDLAAAQLILRRGMILVPLIFALEEKISPALDLLAKFYPTTLSIVQLNIEPLLNQFQMDQLRKAEICAYCYFGRLYLMEALINKLHHPDSSQTNPFMFEDKEIAPKSVVFSSQRNLSLNQSFSFVPLYPLAAFDLNQVQQIETEINSPPKKFPKFGSLSKKSSKNLFQVYKILSSPNSNTLGDSNKETNLGECPFMNCPLRTSEPQFNLDQTSYTKPSFKQSYFESSPLKEIIQGILKTRKIVQIKGKILENN